MKFWHKITINHVLHFGLRFAIWLVGFGFFIVAVAFILAGNNGTTTFNVLFEPFRILIGIADPKKYGNYILIPSGVIMCLIALFLNYRRTKKIRLDYVMAIVAVVISGPILSLLFKVPLLKTTIDKTTNMEFPLVEYPLSILFSLVPIPFFAIGLGIMSGAKIMPNCFPIFVSEIASTAKITYRKAQWIVDFSFIFIGLIFMIISIAIGQHDGDKPMAWTGILRYLGICSLVSWIVQGHLIHQASAFTKLHMDKIWQKMINKQIAPKEQQ